MSRAYIDMEELQSMNLVGFECFKERDGEPHSMGIIISTDNRVGVASGRGYINITTRTEIGTHGQAFRKCWKRNNKLYSNISSWWVDLKTCEDCIYDCNECIYDCKSKVSCSLYEEEE